MALLDFYGQTPDYYGGLLGVDELNRLRQQAQEQGTLNMATALLQAGAPSRTPGGGALAIAQGLQMGQDAYRKALNQGLQEKMAGLQVQDLIQQRAEKERAKQLFAQAYQPERTITEYEPLTPQQIERANEPGFVAPSTTKVIPASFDLNRVAPLIQAGAAGQEGIDQLLKRMSLQKAITGDTTTLAEGATLVRTNPLTGQVETVATGAPKQDLAGPVKQAMQVLGINKPFAEVTPQERTLIGQYIDRQESLKSPKVAVDLKDPTAVAKAQSAVLKDWTSVLESGKAGEVADRYLQAVNAVKLGNQGNKSADGALIYAVGKIYDPSGAVQEGDKNTIVGNRSLSESIRGLGAKVFRGESLLPDERRKLLDIVQPIVEAKSRNIDRNRSPYVDISKQMGGTGDLLRNPIADALSERKTLDELLGGKR